MLLGKKFEAFVEKSPVSVMVRGTLERILHTDVLEELFRCHAVWQYTFKITFTQCVQVMDAVVFQTEPSVGAWFQENGDSLSASRQSLYDKLRRVEPALCGALVRHSAEELLRCVRSMPQAPKAPLPGYRLRVLDGNHLAGTQKRLKGLRVSRAAALPGQALVFYDPRYDLITDALPCEDAYTQERALLEQLLPRTKRNDCVLADRNFCTTRFLFGLHRRGAFFVIRQHAMLTGQAEGKKRFLGADGKKRRLQEQTLLLTDAATGETLSVRRVTIPLRQPNDHGETELHVLTNVPQEKAAGVRVADLYAERWTIENAFEQLTLDLKCEIDTLGYPKAALFGFCTACVAYNAVSLVKAALRATVGADFVKNRLSMYYLTREIARVTGGMEIAIPQAAWAIFRRMSREEFVATLLDLAARLQVKKYRKHKRAPKKPPPRKASAKGKCPHVSTARVINQQ